MDVESSTISCSQVAENCRLDNYTSRLLDVESPTVCMICDSWMCGLFLTITLENYIFETD